MSILKLKTMTTENSEHKSFIANRAWRSCSFIRYSPEMACF